MPFFSKDSKKCLGVDIGATSIKIVELSKKGDNISLSNYGIAAIKDITGKNIRIESDESLTSSKTAITETVNEILKEAGYLDESDNGHSDFRTNIESITARIPLLKHLRIELRMAIFILVFLAVLLFIIYLLTLSAIGEL